MAESDTASVECPLCGEAFDPTAAGGWCTNSECGEWQHEVDVTPDQQDPSEPDERESNERANDADPSADDGTASPATDGLAETSATDGDATAREPAESERAGSVPDTDDASADGAEGSGNEETERGLSEDETTEGEVANDEETEGEVTEEEETFDCPGCDASLDVDVNFCPHCGEDVSGLPAGDDGLDACPSCSADVDPEDNFCVECGEDLDAHRNGTDALTECPDCGGKVDDSDRFCAGCGADLDAHRSGTDGSTGDRSSGTAESPAPDALALTAHGKSVVVEDGDAVGREIRSLLTDAGRPEDEAVRVHREHVRFVRESDGFHVVALGQNPTRVNDVSLAQGDREPVVTGDELHLSDVVTLGVEAA